MTSFPQELLNGYQKFKSGRFSREQERYEILAERGQKPKTLVIACCDSRAAPELIFNARPGELFVVRNVANLVPPYAPDDQHHATSAAIEFAVQTLKVESIVVMGHGRCGGIAAALDPALKPLSPGNFIGRWMDMLKPIALVVRNMVEKTPADRQTTCERMSVCNSLANLRTFPWIEQLEKEEKLSLHGAWFDIASGELWLLDQLSDQSSILDDHERFRLVGF